MSVKENRIALTLIGLLSCAALSIGIFVSQHSSVKHPININQFHGTFFPEPRKIEQFTLMGSDHKVFNNQSLQGQWTMMFFGFTSCGYVCPTTMAELAKMYRILSEKKIKPLPKVVLVSIDPERDTFERLKNYTLAFNPNFYGVRGEDAMVKKMTRLLGIAYSKEALPTSKNPANYDIQHSGAVMLFNPQGELAAFFTSPHQAEMLAEDYLIYTGSQS